MFSKPPSRSNPSIRSPEGVSSNAPAAKPAGTTLRWARGLLGRAGSSPVKPESVLVQMRDELRLRLMAHDPSTQAVRHLYVVYKELGRNGWAGAAALPGGVTRLALAEAQTLQAEDASPLLALTIERLRGVAELADVLAEAETAVPEERWALTQIPEVTETSYDEYELMERSWIGTVPSPMERPPPDPQAA